MVGVSSRGRDPACAAAWEMTVAGSWRGSPTCVQLKCMQEAETSAGHGLGEIIMHRLLIGYDETLIIIGSPVLAMIAYDEPLIVIGCRSGDAHGSPVLALIGYDETLVVTCTG